MFNNINEAIQWVTLRTKSLVGLADFSAYLQSKGNPQHQLKCIHVAGTNGKGSTTNFIRSILQTCGYKVGSFTSPHLITHLDRIRINDENIDEQFFLDCVNKYKKEWEENQLSMFQIDMFISILYFIEKKVDYVVYEVGLGGRLDATNVINPLVSVITNIEMDHMAILGDTFEKIAYEKAGIIKPNKPVFTFEKKDCVLDVFKQVALKNNSELYLTLPVKNISIADNLQFDYRNIHVSIPTLAAYQTLNASLAIEVCLYLNDHNIIKIEKENILKGLNTIWKGRFEVINNDPLIIIDGAHNENGITTLKHSLDYIKGEKVIVFSALKDKEYSKMIDIIKNTGELIITQFESQRSQSADLLALNKDVKVITDYKQAIKYALSTNKIVVITGSLYFISLVREYLLVTYHTKRN